jgi:hypothetical protein
MPAKKSPSEKSPKAPLTVPEVPSASIAKAAPNTSIESLSGLKLSESLSASIPEFQKLLKPSDVGEPKAFETAGWKRVTDAQRQQDEVAYKELQNYAANIKDGVNTLNAMAQASVAVTKLGKTLVQYATGIQEIKTEMVNFQIAEAGTRKNQNKLAGIEQEIDHLANINTSQSLDYQADLDQLTANLDRKLKKVEQTKAETQLLYPTIDVIRS